MNGCPVHGEPGAPLARRDDEGIALRTFEEEQRRQQCHLAGMAGERSWSRH
jgi:hypothetical protein